MPQENIEDKDDVLIENLNTALFLVLGALGLSASAFLLVQAVVLGVSTLQLSSGLVSTLVFTAVSGVLGLGSLQLFRKRRKVRKEKENSPFYSSR